MTSPPISPFILQPTIELNPKIQAPAALYQIIPANQQPEQSKLTVFHDYHKLCISILPFSLFLLHTAQTFLSVLAPHLTLSCYILSVTLLRTCVSVYI